MRTRSASLALASALSLAAFAQGCVVYRDRFISVRSEVQVDVRGAMPPNTLRESRSLGFTSEVPPAARLDLPAIHAALDEHGEWVEHPAYGSIWVPAGQSEREFVPYGTDGQWQPTSAGWYWQSSLSWGWVAFHYGRWVQIEHTWAWVPGSVFAPAWVDWRQGGGWVGWSPLPPLGAAYTAPFSYCSCAGLAGAGLWGRVVRGAPATSLYARTGALSSSYGYGGTVYSWGPSAESTGVPASSVVTLARAHADSTAVAQASPRSGAATSGSPRSGSAEGSGGAVGRPGGSSTLTALADIPSVLVSDVPAINGTRPLSAFPAYAALRPSAVDPARLASSAVVPYTGAPRLSNTITLGSTIDPGRAAYPTARVATWERYNGVAYAPGNAPSANTPVARVPTAPSGFFDAPSTMATTRPLTSTSFGSAPSNYNAGYAPAARAAPSYAAPTQIVPAYTPSVRTYAAPSYAAPSYVAPAAAAAPVARTYAAPSYAAPAYVAAPAVSAPAVRAAPSFGTMGMGSAVRFR